MRRSSIVLLLFLLIGLGSMLFAADVMVLRPVKKDLAVAKEMKALLGPDGRDWIEPESKVKLLTCKGEGDRRLAQDGSTGVAVEIVPRREALYAKTRARYLVAFLADSIHDRVSVDQPIAWVEVIFKVGDEFPFKTLLRWDADNEAWYAPEPPVPAVFKPEDLPPEPLGIGTGSASNG
ncbi:MAG: hypothetical protein QNJ98_12990 [Planctomycetota bacterium]|nr:hypothetical protein [Planctomycetota bacterium]